MALDSKLAKSTSSPQVIWSLMRGGTGDNDDWVAIGCTSAGAEVDVKG